jgi:hypothetical protein
VAHTNHDYGYSIAHPPGIETVDNTVLGPEYDYFARDLNGDARVYVAVYPDEGYDDIGEYGDTFTVRNAEIISEGLVLEGRINPSYRINYIYPETNIRGSALITLARGNAIWAFVDGRADNWVNIEWLTNEVFLRVAVKP